MSFTGKSVWTNNDCASVIRRSSIQPDIGLPVSPFIVFGEMVLRMIHFISNVFHVLRGILTGSYFPEPVVKNCLNKRTISPERFSRLTWC